ncbi:MAG: tetratricopeptide repeat protein [Planctomycetaceae bacterium]|nr:tetratricopeptide repeat protein [Planctomycetaceae bacterium]
MSSQDSPIIERQQSPYRKLILVGLVSLCAAATGMALSLYGSQLLIKTTKSPQSTKTANKGGPLPAAIERPDSISPFSLTLSGESLLDEQYEWSGISITERVRRGEEFLRSHEPQRAAEEFGLVLDSPADEATHSGRTYLMYGIARELLGDLDGSLRSYREAFRRAQHPWQKACVTLRLAHGMSQQDDQWATAVGVLMSSMLRQGAATPLNVYNESIISLSLYMTGKQSDIPATTHLIDDATLLVPPCPVNPDDILQQWDQAWSLPSDAITQLQLDSVRKLGPQPNEWLIKVKSPTMAVEDLLSALAQKGEWALRITDAGRHILSGRSITLNTRELSTEVFLDALLLPLGAEWQFDGQVLQVSSIAETIPTESPQPKQPVEWSYQNRAAKYLRFGLVQAQDHPLAPKVYTYLARLELASGKAAAAAGYMEQVLNQFPSSPVAATMWFNLARIRMQEGQRPLALQAFFHSADHMDGALTTGASYLYAGRLLIEEQKPDKAISLLFRSTTLLTGEPRGRAALLLATAYLMTEELSSANQVLWDNQKDIALPQLDDQAAFLTAFIRYRSSPPARKEYMARNLMTAMTHLDRERLFGESWFLLQAEACHELGISEERQRIIMSQLQKPLPEAQQLQLRLMLGHVELKDKNAATTATEADALLSIERALRLERQGQTALAIAECKRLLAEESTSKDNRLKTLAILGRCYQQLGQHDNAILCFVGMLPSDVASIGTNPDTQDQQ